MSEAINEKILLELPAMYADHHVVEVRRILLNLPGMLEVYASSAYKVVEATYDPLQVTAQAIRSSLDAAGYLGELAYPTENGSADQESPVFFRHTAAQAQSKAGVSFGQYVNSMGRPLWPCPGMGVIKNMEE